MKVVLFDIGKKLEDRDVLLPGARNAVSHPGDAGLQGEAAILALVSNFNMLDNLIRNSSSPVTVSLSTRS